MKINKSALKTSNKYQQTRRSYKKKKKKAGKMKQKKGDAFPQALKANKKLM